MRGFRAEEDSDADYSARGEDCHVRVGVRGPRGEGCRTSASNGIG